ncbi:uncharacterized protein LOC126896118 [Daktulosphaira vitifoliae]|uniref:uncharacterized protein LOC126896118 n=1 Tax=Daktulosphaira vitifoliae TaxID=58002 RepID=UPI0021AAAE9A|nr:uncharacterized protein LOC126896118 [Daktulosphaira vitifoliae]XP_050524560.1 uncharacterized protein LOC126896118 [Daktulosphaira vitifoliae]
MFSSIGLLFDKNNCYEGTKVNYRNVEEKLRKTILLINRQYTVSFAWIVQHLTEIRCDCIYWEDLRDTKNFPHCVKLFKSSIVISKQLIIRFISAIKFLINLLDIDTNPFILQELKDFIPLVNKIESQETDDKKYLMNINNVFKEKYTNKSNLYKILQSQNISVFNLDFLNRGKFKYFIEEKKEFKNFTYFEYVEHYLRNYINNKTTEEYFNLGFSYDKERKTTSYVHDLEV